MRLTQEQVVAGLIKRDVPEHTPRSVAMNLADESRFDTGLQERVADAGPYNLMISGHPERMPRSAR
ncbi:hypothetical protein ACD589_24755 [Rhizobium sp. 814_E9_N1_1]|uniref:hypothetical protein n=1 Tax=unclassified Rhizobium TaxID=2613769 RepID=UPI003F239549